MKNRNRIFCLFHSNHRAKYRESRKFLLVVDDIQMY